MALKIQTLKQLRIQAQQDLEAEGGGLLRQALVTALAYAIAGIGYVYLRTLQWLALQLFLDTASPAYALLWASIYGIDPNLATPSTGLVQATGVAGTVITAGLILQRADGWTYTVDAAVVMAATGESTVSVTAVDAGLDGDAIATTALTFTAPPVGLDAPAIVIGDGLENGFDPETSESVQARALVLIRAPRRGGSEEDYVIWATSRAGIANAYARGSWAGIGTVLVIIAKSWDPTDPLDSPIPTAAQILDVETYLQTQKPAGLHVVAVVPPVLQPLDPYIVLDPDTPDIRAAVQRSLSLQLASVEPGTLARYDDMVGAIDRAAGEEHHRLFVAQGGDFGPYDTPVGADNLLIIGTPTWTEPP
jgi:uncharacterized phage protein gp47/JayE